MPDYKCHTEIITDNFEPILDILDQNCRIMPDLRIRSTIIGEKDHIVVYTHSHVGKDFLAFLRNIRKNTFTKIEGIPCGHTNVCNKCYDRLPNKQCPICKQQVTMQIKLFN